MRVCKWILACLGLGLAIPAMVYFGSLLVTRVAIAGHGFGYSTVMLRGCILAVLLAIPIGFGSGSVWLSFIDDDEGCLALVGGCGLMYIGYQGVGKLVGLLTNAGLPSSDATPAVWATAAYGVALGILLAYHIASSSTPR